MKWNDHDRNEFFRRWLREHKVTCSCGGPQCGTVHAPDCAIELEWDEAMACYDDENTVDAEEPAR